MGRQTTLMAKSEHAGDKRYRFYLFNNNLSGGQVELSYAPQGWEETNYVIARNRNYHGLTRKVTAETMTFVKDGRDHIRDIYELQGINGEILFKIKKFDTDTWTWPSTYFFEGKIDLSTYAVDETGVEVQIIDTSLHEKMKNRESIEVNLKGNTSIGGFEITPFAVPQLEFGALTIDNTATWDKGSSYTTTNLTHYVPMDLQNSEFDEAQSQTIGGTDPFFDTSTDDYTANLSGTVAGTVETDAGVAEIDITVSLVVGGATVQTYSDNVSGIGNTLLSFSFSIDEDITINTGDTAYLSVLVIQSGGGSVTATTTYSTADLVLSDEYLNLSARTIYAWPFYEAFLKVSQHILDKQDAFYSTYFGRTDTPINTYASDGELGHLTKGLYIRSNNTYNDVIGISLRSLFDNLSKVFNLGMGIEDSRIRVEELSYWYDDEEILDISGRIRTENIAKEVDPELHFSEIETGYNSYLYEQIGGLQEFNTKVQFSTELSAVDNKCDLVNEYRADMNGIIKLRNATTDTSEDEDGDEDIFIIDAVRDGADMIVRTSEDWDTVTGGVDADKQYNLYYSPGRNLRRHGERIRAGLNKSLNSIIRYQASDKSTELTTKLVTESAAIDEDADIMVSELDEPFFLPEIYSVEFDLQKDDIETIEANPKGLIKIDTDKYGWIMELEASLTENKASVRLLRANLDVITPS